MQVLTQHTEVWSRPFIATIWFAMVTLAALPEAFAAAPPNDNFASRAVLTGTPVEGKVSNVEATREAFEPDDGQQTVWWTWIAPSDGIVRMQTVEPRINYPALTVYNGSTIDTLKVVGATYATFSPASVTFPTVAGEVYQIAVGSNSLGGQTGSGGIVGVDISLTPTTITSPAVVGSAAAANDAFANRTVLVGDVVSGIGYNSDATHESFERDGSTHTLWWTWTAPANAMVTINTTGSIDRVGAAFSSYLSVYNGASIGALMYVANNQGRPASVTFPTVAGAVYQISTGNNDNVGSIVLNISTTPLSITSPAIIGAPANTNDNYANAQSLGSYPAVSGIGYSQDASTESLEPSVNGSHTLWWTWTAPTAGTLSLTTDGSSVRPTVNVYVGNTINTAVNVDNNFKITGNSVSAPVEAGTTYHFSMGSSNGGTMVLDLGFVPAAPVATLTATQPSVTVGSGEIGQFTLNLSGPLATDTFVNFSIKGSAINGTDYTLLKGTKKIKAGKTSKPIKIVPSSDLEGASKKVVKLTLEPGTGYTVGTSSPVKVKIFGR